MALTLSPTLATTEYGRFIKDALEVDLYNAKSYLNTVGYVWRDPNNPQNGSVNIPGENFSTGIRTVEYYNSTNIRVTIHGWYLDGRPNNWYNFYNGSDWTGWTSDKDIIGVKDLFDGSIKAGDIITLSESTGNYRFIEGKAGPLFENMLMRLVRVKESAPYLYYSNVSYYDLNGYQANILLILHWYPQILQVQNIVCKDVHKLILI